MMRSIGPRLAGRFAIAAFDRRGHGRTADTDEPFSYDAMASETIAFLEHIGRRAHVVGHSDGGIIALKVAQRRPDLLRRVVVVGANFHHDGLMEMPELDLNGSAFTEWALRYGVLSPDGVDHARIVASKSLTLFASEPTMSVDELSRIARRVLVMAGDDDVATLSHTCALYEALPESQLAIVPGTSHALLSERTRASARIIQRFLTMDLPPLTYMPIRRPAPVDRN